VVADDLALIVDAFGKGALRTGKGIIESFKSAAIIKKAVGYAGIVSVVAHDLPQDVDALRNGARMACQRIVNGRENILRHQIVQRGRARSFSPIVGLLSVRNRMPTAASDAFAAPAFI